MGSARAQRGLCGTAGGLLVAPRLGGARRSALPPAAWAARGTAGGQFHGGLFPVPQTRVVSLCPGVTEPGEEPPLAVSRPVSAHGRLELVAVEGRVGGCGRRDVLSSAHRTGQKPLVTLVTQAPRGVVRSDPGQMAFKTEAHLPVPLLNGSPRQQSGGRRLPRPMSAVAAVGTGCGSAAARAPTAPAPTVPSDVTGSFAAAGRCVCGCGRPRLCLQTRSRAGSRD